MNNLQDLKMKGPYGKLRDAFQNRRYFIWWKSICEKGGVLHFSNVIKICFKTCHPYTQ